MKLQCKTKLAGIHVFLMLLLAGCSNDSPLDINSALVIPGQRGLAAQQLGPAPAALDSVAAKAIPIAANYLLVANLDEIQSRVLIKFDTLASLSTPIDSTAKLFVNVTRNANDINSTYILLQAYKVTAAWDEKRYRGTILPRINSIRNQLRRAWDRAGQRHTRSRLTQAW